MRILYFTRDYTPHDHRFLTTMVKQELPESGNHPLEIFSLRLERRGLQREDRPFPPEVRQILWKGGTRPITWRNFPTLLLDLRRVIDHEKFDLIHAGPIQSAAFLAALSGFRPLVSMSWGSDLLKDADRNWWLRWVTRFTLQRTSVLIGDCQAVARKAMAFGYPEERIVLFPWGVDLEQFSPPQNPSMQVQDSPAFQQVAREGQRFVLLSVRSWEPVYGVDLVVKAFALAAQQIDGLHLVLLGGGSQAGYIRQILLQHDLMDQVTFAGQVKNYQLPDYYRSSDLYISASHSDGSSVSLMEALACGCPVLVSDIPGNREWITHGEQGWLFPDHDAVALAQGIVQAVRQPEKLPDMRRKARVLAEQRADWKKNSQQLLRAYQLALSSPHPPGLWLKDRKNRQDLSV